MLDHELGYWWNFYNVQRTSQRTAQKVESWKAENFVKGWMDRMPNGRKAELYKDRVQKPVGRFRSIFPVIFLEICFVGLVISSYEAMQFFQAGQWSGKSI